MFESFLKLGASLRIGLSITLSCPTLFQLDIKLILNFNLIFIFLFLVCIYNNEKLFLDKINYKIYNTLIIYKIYLF